MLSHQLPWHYLSTCFFHFLNPHRTFFLYFLHIIWKFWQISIQLDMWKSTHHHKLLTSMPVVIKAGTPWDALEFGLYASICQISTFLKSIKCCKLSAKQVVNRWSHLYSFVWCIFCLYVFSGKTPKITHPPSFCRADGSASPHLFCSLGLQ